MMLHKTTAKSILDQMVKKTAFGLYADFAKVITDFFLADAEFYKDLINSLTEEEKVKFWNALQKAHQYIFTVTKEKLGEKVNISLRLNIPDDGYCALEMTSQTSDQFRSMIGLYFLNVATKIANELINNERGLKNEH